MTPHSLPFLSTTITQPAAVVHHGPGNFREAGLPADGHRGLRHQLPRFHRLSGLITVRCTLRRVFCSKQDRVSHIGQPRSAFDLAPVFVKLTVYKLAWSAYLGVPLGKGPDVG